jgi:CDP-diacylglycerol--glycerol-3-phosphate 3-phosphatidyltransferase
MANFITFIRLILLLVLVLSIYWADPSWQRVNMPLLFLIMVLDALDGWVARKFNETSLFGAVFDIAVDRIVETVLWVVLAHIGLVPVWAAIVFIVRGNIVDTIRNSMAASQGVVPFGMMHSPLGRLLVSSHFSRGFYNTVKIATFGWVLMIQPMPTVYPDHWADISAISGIITMTLVWMSVILCLVRGAPVVVEFLRAPNTNTKER